MNINQMIQHLDKKEVWDAFYSLDPEDQERIRNLAAELDQGVKEKADRKVMFGKNSSMELLAKLGIFLLKYKIKEID